MKKIILTLLSFCVISLTSNAQSWDDSGDSWDDSGDSWGDDGGSWDDEGSSSDNFDAGSNTNTSSMDDSTGGDDEDWGDDDGWGDDGGDFGFGGGADDYVRSARPEVEHKAYERFTNMPFDSASNLVTFVEIVEVIVPDRFLDLGGEDYSLSDSLYARALSWMDKQFGKKEAKRMIEESGIDPDGKEGQTIKAIVVMPLVARVNKYATRNVGVIEFDMELRFKDERYRYKFNNFVHITPNNSGGKKDVRTYMEYYMTAKKSARANDQILMACNDQMNQLIDDLKATCTKAPFVDDDDW